MPVSKVLHVIPSVASVRGGPSVMVRRLAGGLAQRGVETHVATTDDNGPGRIEVPYGQPVGRHGVTYWYFPRQTRFYTVSWPLSVWLSQHVQDFDLVHIHALFSFAALPASYWAARRGVPYVVRPLGTLNTWGMTHRRPWLKRASFEMIESRILAHAALVHYTSEDERRQAELLGITTPSVVVPNPLADEVGAGAPGALRRRYPQLGRRPIVLFLSRLDRKKGLDLLLRAFVSLRHHVPDAALVIAGDGDAQFTRELWYDAQILGVGNDIVWTGFLSGDDKQAAFADATLYVLPSYSENFGIAVAEAMAAGLPVVVSDRVGICRDIASASAGLVVRCEVDDLTQAIVRLLSDSTLSESLGENGRWLATSRYSQEAVTGEVLDMYNRIAGVDTPFSDTRRAQRACEEAAQGIGAPASDRSCEVRGSAPVS